MIVTYQGGKSFKISQGELSLAINPPAKAAADITLFTDRRGEVAEKSGFIIDGPGEYEVKEIFIKGFAGSIFLITMEGIKLCFLGVKDGEAPKPETLEALEEIDILFTPASAYKLAVSLEPALIIPMGYDKASLAQFLKEAGENKVEPIDKLVVKKKDFEGKEGDIVVLKEE